MYSRVQDILLKLKANRLLLHNTDNLFDNHYPDDTSLNRDSFQPDQVVLLLALPHNDPLSRMDSGRNNRNEHNSPSRTRQYTVLGFHTEPLFYKHLPQRTSQIH